MKRWMAAILLTWTLLLPRAYAGEAELTAALNRLETMHGFEAEADLKAIIPAFYKLPGAPDQRTVRRLFDEQRIAQWPSRLADFLGLVTILFEGMSPEEQARLHDEFIASRGLLSDFQKAITHYVRAIHPGFSGLGLGPLKLTRQGRGIRIVVFDVFEMEQLDEQRRSYPKAFIEKPLVFGRPVGLSHGNTVIDVILELAPEASILPVASDAQSYAAAMQHLAARQDLDIINLSRAFPEDPRTHGVDKVFEEALRRWTRQGILVKALGNTGSDLFGQLTRPRVEKGLGPVSSLTAYDLKLIRELYQEEAAAGLELFALNLGLFAEELALTATIPGDYLPVQKRTLAVPAEGIYSPSTETFESGSSFAAPQISAWAALLLEERRALYPDETGAASRAAVYAAMLEKADLRQHPAREWGRGHPTL
ncbi:MAG TPA: S8/S53 family peptidase [Oligoflexus sp.]|uniref:S8/S53 family peptidase n=1 Tax=Oligoflexus sp. TaxID=1971216 RepID=UPI002D7EA088|nr:S8/S53 family peptidase [Oligoflexus sp.]HET9241592.1 S8/S53 family peptidase [Oligoflexus sp.]